MTRYEDDYALVLEGVDKMVADMARGLLNAAGIPSMVHGPDFDVAELGVAAHSSVRGVGVYVPKAAEARAREILGEAFGPAAE
jgi:hypothetical protein